MEESIAYFNSTLVRLKVEWKYDEKGQPIHFNSTLVRLKEYPNNYLFLLLPYFNSTLVRLKGPTIS